MRLSKRYFKSFSSTQRGTRGGGQKKMHSSAIYKGYALYKIDGKNTLQQQNSMWCPFAANIFSEFHYRSEICYLFFYCMVFLSMYTFLFFPYACLWGSVSLFCIFFTQSCSHLTGRVRACGFFFFSSLSFNCMHFSFIGHGEKAIAKIVKREQ